MSLNVTTTKNLSNSHYWPSLYRRPFRSSSYQCLKVSNGISHDVSVGLNRIHSVTLQKLKPNNTNGPDCKLSIYSSGFSNSKHNLKKYPVNDLMKEPLSWTVSYNKYNLFYATQIRQIINRVLISNWRHIAPWLFQVVVSWLYPTSWSDER